MRVVGALSLMLLSGCALVWGIEGAQTREAASGGAGGGGGAGGFAMGPCATAEGDLYAQALWGSPDGMTAATAAVATADHVWIAGRYTLPTSLDVGATVLPPSESVDGWIAQLSHELEVLAVFPITGANAQEPKRIATGGGVVAVAGDFTTEVDFGGEAYAITGTAPRVFVVVLPNDETPPRLFVLDSPSTVLLTDVEVTDDGEVFVAVVAADPITVRPTMDVVGETAAAPQPRLLRISSTVSTTPIDFEAVVEVVELVDLARTPDGDLLAFGHFDGAVVDPATGDAILTAGNRDLFVTRIDPEGPTALETATIGGGGDEQAMRLAVTESGNVVIAGRYAGQFNDDPNIALGMGRPYLARLAPDLELETARDLPLSAIDVNDVPLFSATSMAAAGDDVVLAGSVGDGNITLDGSSFLTMGVATGLVWSVDQDLNDRWAWQIGDLSISHGLAVLPCGSALAVGEIFEGDGISSDNDPLVWDDPSAHAFALLLGGAK